jgi:hypothetical protein
MAELWFDRADAMPRPCCVWVKNGSGPASVASPFYTQEQTPSDHPGMSEKCQDATSSMQVLEKKSPPVGGFSIQTGDLGSGGHQRCLCLPAISHEADASQAKDHHRAG